MTETLLWEGKPSQLRNIKYFAICLLLCWLVAPIYLAWRRYQETARMRYEIKDKAVLITHPKSFKHNRLLEMYRIQRVESHAPIPYDKLSLCDVTFYPIDNFTPPVVFQAVSFPEGMVKQIQDKADAVREAKRIKEIPLTVLQ